MFGTFAEIAIAVLTFVFAVFTFFVTLRFLWRMAFLFSREFINNEKPFFSASETEFLKQAASVVIFVPHPDDELIACFSVIKRALKFASQLSIVFMTNGDGVSLLDRATKNRRYSQEYFQEIATKRKMESLAVLTSLGLESNNVVFLGYPDGGLSHLWNQAWATPWLSPSTGAQQTPVTSFHPSAPYTGRSLVADIEALLERERPTHVIFPSAFDKHPDHYSTQSFVQLALAEQSSKAEQFTYLVHRGNWPRKKLGPPRSLTPTGLKWISLPLSTRDVAEKQFLLQRYRTQLQDPVMRRYLNGFIKGNELFARTPGLTLRNDGQPVVLPHAENIGLTNFLNPCAQILGASVIFTNGTLQLSIRTARRSRGVHRFLIDIFLYRRDYARLRVIKNYHPASDELTTVSFPVESSQSLRFFLVTVTSYRGSIPVDHLGTHFVEVLDSMRSTEL